MQVMNTKVDKKHKAVIAIGILALLLSLTMNGGHSERQLSKNIYEKYSGKYVSDILKKKQVF